MIGINTIYNILKFRTNTSASTYFSQVKVFLVPFFDNNNPQSGNALPMLFAFKFRTRSSKKEMANIFLGRTYAYYYKYAHLYVHRKIDKENKQI